MKSIVFALALGGLLGQAAWADNQNIYCGKGKESFSVDEAQIALVVQDDEISLYLDGKDVSADYTLSTTTEGFKALAKGGSRHNPPPSFAFNKCQANNETTAHFISSMVPETP